MLQGAEENDEVVNFIRVRHCAMAALRVGLTVYVRPVRLLSGHLEPHLPAQHQLVQKVR